MTITQEYVEFYEVSTRKVVAVGVAEHESRMYKFSHCITYSSDNALISYSNEVSRICNERVETSTTNIFNIR